MDSISFFKLPLLVQSKILREHVPVFQKAFTLSVMPEFQDLLQSKHSWLNFSDEFFNFYDLLRSFKPGFYVSFGKYGSCHACVISITNNIVSFAFCRLDDYILIDFLNKFPIPQNSNFIGSLSKVTTFLTKFFKKYIICDEKNLILYKLHESHFFVNRLTNNIYWLDGNIYTFKNNECFISDKCGYNHFMLLNDNDKIHLKCLPPSTKNDRCPCLSTLTFCKPMKFYFTDTDHYYKGVTFEFQMDDKNNDSVSINVKILNRHTGSFYLDSVELLSDCLPQIADFIRIKV